MLKQPHIATGYLNESDQWEIDLDLGKKLVCPDIVQTTLTTYIVFWSPKHKCLAIVEMTQECSLRGINKCKTEKYAELSLRRIDKCKFYEYAAIKEQYKREEESCMKVQLYHSVG